MESRELQSRSPSETTTATLSSGPSLATSSVLFLPPQESAQSPRFISKAAEWIRGPNPPTDGFKPLFPGLQSWPADTFQRIVKHRSRQILALVVYLLVWLVAFIVVVHYSQFAGSIEGLTPARLSCSTALWSKNNGCGLNGEGCLPFENSTVAFRCPADCITGSQVLNPRAVGTEVVAYRTFVVGGPTAEEASSKESYGTYRADSFVCASAIHAGLITPRFGGCGVLSQIGESANFPSSDRNGISSISFDARFPSSYTFLPGVRSSSCRDLRWHLFAVSIPFTTVLSLVSPSPAIPFFATFAGIFFHVALASDPPYLTNPYDMVSRALSRFLPAIFIAHFLWSYVLRRPHRLAPNVERTILYLGGLWVGALTNITLDAMIPINRLTGRDLEQQPGAKAALAIIVIILCVLVVGQVHFLRLSGQLPTMLGVYAAIGVGLGLLASIPGTTLRIHHYIIGLLLVPGCRVCTRPALLYQGLLLGLFINGIARWGFAGIVETPGSLQGDGLYFSTVPEFLPAPVAAPGNVTVYWPWMPEAAGAPGSSNEAVGVSVIVNDVERYEWRAAMAGNTSVLEGEYTFSRGGGEKSYLRLAWMLRSGQTLDYTRAGVVEADGEWRAPEEGGS